MQWHRHEMATSACVTGNRATVTRIVSDYKSIQTLLISKFLLQFACQQLSSIVSRESGESSSLHLCSTQPLHCMMASSSESVAIDKQVEQTNVHMRSLLALNPTESCFGHCTCPAAGLTLPVLQ